MSLSLFAGIAKKAAPKKVAKAAPKKVAKAAPKKVAKKAAPKKAAKLVSTLGSDPRVQKVVLDVATYAAKAGIDLAKESAKAKRAAPPKAASKKSPRGPTAEPSPPPTDGE